MSQVGGLSNSNRFAAANGGNKNGQHGYYRRSYGNSNHGMNGDEEFAAGSGGYSNTHHNGSGGGGGGRFNRTGRGRFEHSSPGNHFRGRGGHS